MKLPRPCKKGLKISAFRVVEKYFKRCKGMNEFKVFFVSEMSYRPQTDWHILHFKANIWWQPNILCKLCSTIPKNEEKIVLMEKLSQHIQLGEKGWTKRYIWSKIDEHLLRSLALSVPIHRNFQSNGAYWRSIKRWRKKIQFLII